MGAKDKTLCLFVFSAHVHGFALWGLPVSGSDWS